MDMSRYFTMTEQFYQRYLWFLSLLLLFSVVFLLLYKAINKWAGPPSRKIKEIEASNKSIYGALFFTGILTVILYIPTYIFLSPDMGWFSLGNIIQFQPTKLVFTPAILVWVFTPFPENGFQVEQTLDGRLCG